MTKSDRPGDRPRYAAVVDSAVPANYVVGSRSAEEKAAIAALLERTPKEARDVVMKALQASHIRKFESYDPEIARLFGLVASIRAVDARAQAANRELDLKEAPAPPDAKRFRVRIALVERIQGVPSDAIAVASREPGDEGIPLLVIASDIDHKDLHRALGVARLALEQGGTEAAARTAVTLRRRLPKENSRAAPQHDEARWRSMLAEIRAAPERVVDRIGRARVIEFLVDP